MKRLQTTVSKAARDHIYTAVDLTRACAAHEYYPGWLSRYGRGLQSSGIMQYLGDAVIAFEEQLRAQPASDVDVFVARENLSDILMASAPLDYPELRTAASRAIAEARDESPSTLVAAV